MNRSEFLRSCAAGVCACGPLALLAPTAEGQTTDSQIAGLQDHVDAVQTRFASLVAIIGRHVDAETRSRIFRSLGRECAKNYRSLTDKYKNDLAGFLAEGRRQWMASAEYRETAGTLRIVDKSRGCTCPLVKTGSTPAEFCDCTLGWQEEVYSAILGKPVRAELEESCLRGGSRCVFLVRIA